MQTETVDQLLSLLWRAVSLQHFETGKKTNPKAQALIAVSYVKTDLQLTLNWCLAWLTLEEYDSEERKRSKVENVLLMMHLSYLMSCEAAAMACAMRRDALCFVKFLLKQMSAAALNTYARILKEEKAAS